MRPVRFTVSGSATSNVYPLDYWQAPFQLSIGAAVTGVASYTLQYTYADVQATGFDASAATWYNHPLMTTLTATSDTVINGGPVMGVRVTNVGTGSVAVTLVQAGSQ